MGDKVFVRRLHCIMTFLIVISWSACVAHAADAPGSDKDVQYLVSKIIEAYGGEEVIEGLKSVHATGDIEAFMRQDNGTYELYFRRPRKLRVETRYRRSAETRILNGDIGYRGMDGFPLSRSSGDSLLAMVYQYKHFDLPYGLLKGVYSISRKETEDLNRKSTVVLHLTDSEGPPMDVYVDTNTFFIVRVTGYFSVPGGGSTSLSAEFSDFRKVDRAMFPFRIVNYAGGYRIAETVMKTYTIDQPMPDSLFAP